MVFESALGTVGTAVGTSALAGGVTGFITKKLIKLVIALGVLTIAGLAYLDHQGILTVHWTMLDHALRGVHHTIGVHVPEWLTALGATLPVGAGFVGGFALGYLKA